MRKIILSLAISFDGYIEGPNGEIDWISFSDEAGQMLNNFIKGIDTILYGRVSYEAWGTYEPGGESMEAENSFYNSIHRMKKYVFSTTRTEFPGNPIVVQSGIAEAMNELKKQPGKDIWLYGGSSLITTFMNLDLVDKYLIAVYPVVLGAGKPLFKDINHRIPLRLVNVEKYKEGEVLFTYERKTKDE